jgi:membrane protease YdiL (CAAX protease family)
VGIILVVGPGGIPGTPVQTAKPPFVYSTLLVGPSIAGILMSVLVDGKAGLRALLSRLLRWRVGAGWYAIALLTAPVLTAAILFALSLTSPVYVPAIVFSDDKVSMLTVAIMLGLVVGFFEELGWTGFAIPRLRLRHGVLTTGLVVGLLWGAWHFLMFWESDSFAAALPLALLLGRLFSWLPAFRVLMVWVYDRTGSLLVPMLMHASLVVSQLVLLPVAISGLSLLTSILALAAVLWIFVAVIRLANGGRVVPQPLQRRVA